VAVGWAKARLRAVPTIKTMRETLVGTLPDAFASGRFAHPTRYSFSRIHACCRLRRECFPFGRNSG
jgi:hypothetical protein